MFLFITKIMKVREASIGFHGQHIWSFSLRRVNWAICHLELNSYMQLFYRLLILPPPPPYAHCSSSSKALHRCGHANLLSTLGVTQCDPPPPPWEFLATPLKACTDHTWTAWLWLIYHDGQANQNPRMTLFHFLILIKLKSSLCSLRNSWRQLVASL